MGEQAHEVGRLLASSGLPAHEARRLMAAVLGIEPGEVRSDGELDAAAASRFGEMAARRLAGEPLQYLEGVVDFDSIRLRVDSRALIPRPETEQLWVLAMSLHPHPVVAADICTGAGALALAVKHAAPSARVIGTDISGAALDLARSNGEMTGLEVEWRKGDLFAGLPEDLIGAIDLIVCNPPYVSAAEWPRLPADVRWEPRLALVAGPTGLEMIGRVFREAAAWLSPDGSIVCEIGDKQVGQVKMIMTEAGISGSVQPDLTGRPRFAVGRQI